jgi:uncharacterized protein (DUF2062 family)
MKKIESLLRKKLLEPIGGFLKQGITPKRLAVTIALGAIVGVFPVLGTCSLICAGLAFAMRLNMAAIQLANYLVYPLQLILFYPHVRIGQWVFNDHSIPISLEEAKALFAEDLFSAIQILGSGIAMGVVGWGILGVPVFLVIYFTTYPVLRKMLARRQDLT